MLLKTLWHKLTMTIRHQPAVSAAPRTLPKRVVILLTNPRSGSTWLFDALRCHPALTMHPDWSVYEQLGMTTGRRYPLDLSNGANARLSVEVQRNLWDKIPDFHGAIAEDWAVVIPPAVMQQSYAVEKCHPPFYGFDARAFAQRLQTLNWQIPVRMIYQVRDPHESALSILQYKQRNPSWLVHISPTDVPEYLAKTYESMLGVAQAYPSLVLDYHELMTAFPTTLKAIAALLWGDQPLTVNGQDAVLLDFIDAQTHRDKRVAENTKFLGKHLGKQSALAESAPFANLIAPEAPMMQRCYAAYQALLAMRRAEPSLLE